MLSYHPAFLSKGGEETGVAPHLEQLEVALKDVSAEQAEDEEMVQDYANAAAEEAGKEKPNPKKLKITGESLKKAAENLLGVAPIAVQIAKVLTGIG
jgi:hypothetical protein